MAQKTLHARHRNEKIKIQYHAWITNSKGHMDQLSTQKKHDFPLRLNLHVFPRFTNVFRREVRFHTAKMHFFFFLQVVFGVHRRTLFFFTAPGLLQANTFNVIILILIFWDELRLTLNCWHRLSVDAVDVGPQLRAKDS